MREIKFRGLYNGTWVYGSLIKRTVRDKVDYVIENADMDDYLQYIVDEKSIGQFTGLKDKNGVEIYEGDIVKGLTIRGNISYYHACFHIINHKNRGLKNWALSTRGAKSLSVIGSINENPELLTYTH